MKPAEPTDVRLTEPLLPTGRGELSERTLRALRTHPGPESALPVDGRGSRG
ncbi:hypothetical protein [Streptomyces sp. NPDC060366]|uniref:hypothetical protein n=1 Tax=Streptomyces sp. NPDC060366 TaxID=3347105 RepID=UPI00365C0B67